VLAAIALLALFGGARVFAALVAVTAVVLAWEWRRITRRDLAASEDRVGWAIGFGLVAVMVLGAARLERMALAGLVIGAIVAVLLGSARDRVAAMWMGLGICWIGFPCLALIWLRQLPDGEAIMVWLLLVVWTTDTAAFAAGRSIGGAKLAPAISPNKTWAGLGGAVFGAGVTSVIVGAIVDFGSGPGALAVAGAGVAVVAQAGDLAESFVKRRFGVKDFGNLIPGHGGMFDRVDGLLAAAVVVALWMIARVPGV
jgi:phosphatidate cytidylyltransferase